MNVLMKKNIFIKDATTTSGQNSQCLPWVAAGPLIMVLTTADLWLLNSGSSASSLCGEINVNQ